ncbi:alpha/beta hydrolase [Mycobacterium sp. 29Ha]|uniref:alpha/beta fold hydrolase n=1 Tax=Mycobacterium sp. 29Ha TaxID=2939268 RepID=UPI0029392E99|nr:alpha/beta hydrolase [Mycobacterium sp. 29Ha]MDV3133425.1 alpha/beta hydrolase [Mycobacterium sp. 29Ha]
MPPTRDYQLPLNDTWLNITEWGSETPEVTVVLAHGWTLSSRIWQDVASDMVTADPNLRVLAYDHRGHGRSARVPTASIEQLADDLAAVVARAAPHGPIVFGGHSLGGMTLIALAQRHPDLVSQRATGAAFVATSAGELLGVIRQIRATEYLMNAVLGSLGPLQKGGRPVFLLRHGVRGTFGKRPRRHDMDRILGQAAQSDPRAVAALGRSIMQHHRYDDLQAFCGLDVVVMAGNKDRLTPPLHAQRIADRLPNSELVILSDAGHYLPYERRHAVTTHLLTLTDKARTYTSTQHSRRA